MHTSRGLLVLPIQHLPEQQGRQSVYNIPCDCDRCYYQQKHRLLKVYIKQHRDNYSKGLLEKSKLALHVYKGQAHLTLYFLNMVVLLSLVLVFPLFAFIS
jgi:hypothetical protein